jgi:polyisoprenyl-teichoic acid--peptidoglycan teichoic acid transferase
MESTRRMTYQKKHKKKKKIFAIFLLILFLLVAGSIGYGTYLYTKAGNVMNQSYEALGASSMREASVNFTKENFSILFMGVDDSEARDFNGSARTDALMLATFDQDNQSIKLLSIPRDSYVYIPEKDKYDKINHAHTYGGVSATAETVEELVDIPVDYYIKMNFQAFVEVVDTLGGVEVNVPYELFEKDSDDRSNAIHIEAGLQALDGEEALAFARTRKQDNDIERGKRQQQLIEAVVKEATSVSSITKYSSLIDDIGNNVKTNFTTDEMNYFISYAAKGNELNIESLNLAGEDSMIDGVYYYQLDEASILNVQNELKQHLEITGYAQSSVADHNKETANFLDESEQFQDIQ